MADEAPSAPRSPRTRILNEVPHRLASALAPLLRKSPAARIVPPLIGRSAPAPAATRPPHPTSWPAKASRPVKTVAASLRSPRMGTKPPAAAPISRRVQQAYNPKGSENVRGSRPHTGAEHRVAAEGSRRMPSAVRTARRLSVRGREGMLGWAGAGLPKPRSCPSQSGGRTRGTRSSFRQCAFAGLAVCRPSESEVGAGAYLPSPWN